MSTTHNAPRAAGPGADGQGADGQGADGQGADGERPDHDHIVASLARSRARLRELLDPGAGAAHATESFPRSRTMRLLASGHGAGTAAAVGAGLLLIRPTIGLRLLKIIPLGAIARLLLSRLLTASGAKT